MAQSGAKFQLQTDLYLWQRKKFWPKTGRHILAQFDEETVVVYQAFKPEIAEYAVTNQRFGGDHYSFERMSWIKPNFLWMMYRCGWTNKAKQERVLAIRITRNAFETILANAYTVELQKSQKLETKDIKVRLQWDPDHSPSGGSVTRRAIQLGMKGQILEDFGTKWIVQIDDITQFVKEQHKKYTQHGDEQLMTPSERVYPLIDANISARIGLDFYEEHYKHAVIVKAPIQRDAAVHGVDNDSTEDADIGLLMQEVDSVSIGAPGNQE